MRSERGFTTREPWVPLLVVVLLAAIAFVLFRRLGSDARVREVLERNLGYLSIAEGDHFRSRQTYTADFAALRALGSVSLTLGAGNILTIVHADSAGFVAVGTNARLTGPYRTCGIYAGTVAPSPNPALKRPNTVACW